MSDGASLGITPKRALETILGGKPPPESDEGMTKEELREWVMSVDPSGPYDYNDCGRRCAKMILEHVTDHPEDIDLPAKGTWDHEDGISTKTNRDIYDAVKETHPEIEDLGLSGFLWGWGLNAAYTCLDKRPVRNPAIIEI